MDPDPEFIRLRTTLLLVLAILDTANPGSIYAPLNLAGHGVPPDELPDKVWEIATAIMAKQQGHAPEYDLLAAAMVADCPSLATMAEARADYLQRQVDTFPERLTTFQSKFNAMPGNSPLADAELAKFSEFMREQSELPLMPMRVAHLRFVAQFARLVYDPRKTAAVS